MLKNGLLLALFALICTAVVAFVNQLTADKIKQQEQLQLQGVLQQIIPNSIHDNDLTKSCILLKSETGLGTQEPMPAYIATKNGKPVAIAIEALAPDGYSGNIKLILALNNSGEVLGVRTLSQHETPGLGDKIELTKSDWVLSFSGKTMKSDDDVRWFVKKDGGEIDQFTGATITPRAYVKAIRHAISYFKAHQQTIFNQQQNCGVSND